MTMQPQNPPAHVGMLQLLNGAHVAGAISCLVQLGIPDLVEAGPKSSEELANQISAQPDALYGLMRATASVGVLSEGHDGTFSETPMSAVLRKNAIPRLRGLAIMGGSKWHGRAWSHLEHCVRTGKQALDHIYGAHIFEYFKQRPEEAQIFDEAMTSISTIDSPQWLALTRLTESALSWTWAVGTDSYWQPSWRGTQMRGTLYDAPHVVEGARNGSLKALAECRTLASGDMFSSMPANADAYIMKHIIHDWPHDLCLKILKACRKNANAGGQLLVVDDVVQPGNEFSPGKFLDLQMLIFPGERERTEKEFRELFAAAGWQLSPVIPTFVPESIVEGIPA
jgi:hypothetical protein